MHNLHYVLINAKTPEQACFYTEDKLNDFDDYEEDNYYDYYIIIGAINLNDNSTYVLDDSNHWDIENFTIENINEGLSKEFNKKVNILEDDLEEYESLIDECGVTDYSDDSSKDPKFIVVLDVKS
jgi:hypothetical protein